MGFFDSIMDGVKGSAARTYKEQARNGNAKAQYMLARCYALGFGVEESFSDARYWCKESAGQGFSLAKQALGEFDRGGREDFVNFLKRHGN